MTHRLRNDIGIGMLLLTATALPAFGVLGVVALCLLGLRISGRAPSRRVALSWVLTALPGPIAVVGVVIAPLARWERLVIGCALAMQWLPIDPWARWSCVVAVASLPLWRRTPAVGVLALLPVLQLAATIPWPALLPPVVVALAGVLICVFVIRGARQQAWWSVALLLVGVNSSAAVSALPWVLTVGLVDVGLHAVWGWWAGIAVLAAAGYSVGAGLLVVPLLQRLGQLERPHWRHVLVIVLWCIAPVQGSVARLQTSVGLYGSAWSGDIVGFVDSQQRLVAQFPWVAVGAVVVLLWAAYTLWRTEATDA